MARINFFDEIERNKRNSLIIIGAGAIFYLILGYLFGYLLELPEVCWVPLVMGILLYSLWLYNGGAEKVLLKNAQKISKKDNPFLWNTVEGLSAAAGIPMPEIYIVDDPAPNAFAIGKDPKKAKVAFTTGILSLLKHDELEGVVAHEISHIANRDVQTSLLMLSFVGAVALLSDIMLRTMRLKVRRRRGGDAGALILVIIVVAILSNVFMQILLYALSREREYLADANGAKLTRYPEGLARALEKIAARPMTTKSASESASFLYFVNPFPFKLGELFATHPPIEKRIERLRAM